jgi:rfaE bifunctional protein nucleotidyltransferase chain/domain
MLGIEEAAAFVRDQQQHGRRVVFTHGVFDLLHPGHVRHFTAARREGDVLLVGVHSDRSARRLKGPSRPIMPDVERAEILGSLAAVDGVVIVDDEGPEALIARLKPDVVAKSSVESAWSISAIIKKAQSVPAPSPHADR